MAHKAGSYVKGSQNHAHRPKRKDGAGTHNKAEKGASALLADHTSGADAAFEIAPIQKLTEWTGARH